MSTTMAGAVKTAVSLSSASRKNAVSGAVTTLGRSHQRAALSTLLSTQQLPLQQQPQQQQQSRTVHSATLKKAWTERTTGKSSSSTSFTGTTVRYFSSGGKRDFYKVLGVDRSADKGAVKKAYFKLAKQYHPDANQGDDSASEKFKEVTEAYEILSDDKQREVYNQFGHAGVDPNFSGGQQQGNPFGGFDFSQQGGGQAEMDPEELFDMFFGGGGGGRRRNRGPRRGADLQMHVSLTFQEAVFGTSKDLNLRYQNVNRQTGETQVQDREVTVDTPPGIDNGMNLRLQGQGAEGDPGAPSGNLLVQVIVEPDSYFHRDGYDVHTEVPVSVTQAILGGTVDVKTLTGEVEMKVPKGCQVDAKLMLRRKGIQQLHGTTKGNHIVHLKVEIPKKISERQEALLREFDDETRIHDLGLSGRIANAAGSAYEKLFGAKKKKDGKTKKADKAKAKDDQSDEEDDEKKQAAQ